MGPLPLSPGLCRWTSGSSLLLLTFCKLWPEGTRGSQTMTSVLSLTQAQATVCHRVGRGPVREIRARRGPAGGRFSCKNIPLVYQKNTHKDEVAGCRQAEAG